MSLNLGFQAAPRRRGGDGPAPTIWKEGREEEVFAERRRKNDGAPELADTGEAEEEAEVCEVGGCGARGRGGEMGED